MSAMPTGTGAGSGSTTTPTNMTENSLAVVRNTKTSRSSNKFKTSGIVATAVAKPMKKYKGDAQPFPVLKLDGAATTTTTSTTGVVSEASLKSPTTVKEFVKKVKTKFKKRKNKSEKV